MLDLSYFEQCQRKHNTVVDAFRAYPSLRNIEVSDLRAAPTIHSYRIRAKLVVSDDGIGLFAAGTHDIVDTPSCPVLHPLVRQTVQRLRLLPLVRLGVSSVDVRHVDDGVLIPIPGIISGPLGINVPVYFNDSVWNHYVDGSGRCKDCAEKISEISRILAAFVPKARECSTSILRFDFVLPKPIWLTDQRNNKLNPDG